MDTEGDLNSSDTEESALMNRLPPYPDADEERDLWRRYFRLRRITEIIGPGPNVDKKLEVRRVFFTVVEDISNSTQLIWMLKKFSGLDRLGDKIVEGTNNPTRTKIELYRLIQDSEARSGQEAEYNQVNCCLRDLFGLFFVEMINNIAFGSGNPNLVGKVVEATKGDELDIRSRIYRLAIDRGLLPKDIMGLTDPGAPLDKLPQLIRSTRLEQPVNDILNDYTLLIAEIRVDGKAAFDRIVETHLRLAANGVRAFISEDNTLSVDDLFQEGSVGLMKAAEHFNPAYGVRFMSYAPWRVRQTIGRAVADSGRTIRIPVHMTDTINRLLAVSRHLAQEYGREPTSGEIAQEMEISSDKVREIMKVSQLPISLQSPIDEEEDSPVGNSIEDRNALPPVDAASEQLLKEQIEDVLYTLTPREQRVLQLRFGLVDGRSRTLEEIGQEFELTRERIRQIEAKAFKKLRHPSRSRKLKDYL